MVEPSFNRLVKLVARAFYDDITTKGENQPKNGRSDNRGIAVVVLDALTRYQWVREEDLAKDLKLHTKQLRRILRMLEEEKLVTRDHRKETAKGAKIYNAAVAAMGDGQQSGREGDDKQKMHTHSYCCLDYAQMYDVVRYRLYRMKKKLKDELESKNTIQEYICPSCNRRYTALDALRLVSPHDDYFHCECCNSVLAAESDKLTTQDLGDGDDNVRRRRHENLKNMLAKMEEQLKPLTDQLARVRDLTAPYFGNLQAWELKANAARRSANGDINPNDPFKSSQGFDFGGTPMRILGDTKVEVAFDTDQKDESIPASTRRKLLPPWMIREGMVLHEEQRGESKVESKIGETSVTADNKDDKKSTASNDDAKNIQDEYIKAYYAALLKMHNEQQDAVKKEQEVHNTMAASPGERQIGMKSKHDENLEGDDNEWEEAPAGETTKPFNLNVEAEASEDEDEIDWEEG